MTMSTKRLYIGGLSDSVLETDIKEKFGEFGAVRNVEIKCKENYGNRRYFAYIDIETNDVDICIRKSNNQQWRGGCLKVQQAKESPFQIVQSAVSPRKIDKPEANPQPSGDGCPTEEPRRSAKKDKRKKKSKRDDSDSDDEPKSSYLGVPAMRGIGGRERVVEEKPKKPDSDNDEAMEVEEVQKPRKKQGDSARIEAAQEQTQATAGTQARLYIGGLSDSVLESDLKEKFRQFGKIGDVEIRCKDSYGTKRYFAYMNIVSDDARINECLKVLENDKLKGSSLKVQLAKESALQRVQTELREPINLRGDFRKPREDKESHQKTESQGIEDVKKPLEEGEQFRKPFPKVDPMETDAAQPHWKSDRDSGRNDRANERGDRGFERQDREFGRQDREFGRQDRGFERQDRSFERNDRRGNRDDWSRNPRDRQEPRWKQEEQRKNWGGSGDWNRRYEEPNAFDSEKAGLFEDVDVADQIGLGDDLNSDEEQRNERKDDAISENNLKELFDGENKNGFALSSLFVDKLTVDDAASSDEEESRQPRKSQKADDAERFDDSYWNKAPRGEQKSWKEMTQRDSTFVEKKDLGSFFILPGDDRLQEGIRAFQTDADPSQFVDCWAEQAEELTLRLLQRKRNTRALFQMEQRASGRMKPAASDRRKLRNAIRKASE